MPGYFVVLNPTGEDIKANFQSEVIGTEVSVAILSNGFNKEPLRGKVKANNIPMPKYSVGIFTFVPK